VSHCRSLQRPGHSGSGQGSSSPRATSSLITVPKCRLASARLIIATHSCMALKYFSDYLAESLTHQPPDGHQELHPLRLPPASPSLPRSAIRAQGARLAAEGRPGSPGRAVIDGDLRLLEAHQAELEVLDAELARRGCHDDHVKVLMTLPGVGIAVAQTLLSALGNPTRFPDGDHAASYLGRMCRGFGPSGPGPATPKTAAFRAGSGSQRVDACPVREWLH